MPETKCGFDSIPDGASGAMMLAAYGPTLIVDIGFDQDFQTGRSKNPVPGLKGIHALVDTGASESCIDSALAAQLNLPIVDRRSVAGAHGSAEVSIHLAHIHVPSLGFTIYGAFAGVHLSAGGQPHLALIGRTFLQHCTMIYEGRTGSVSISMQQPPSPAA